MSTLRNDYALRPVQLSSKLYILTTFGPVFVIGLLVLREYVITTTKINLMAMTT